MNNKLLQAKKTVDSVLILLFKKSSELCVRFLLVGIDSLNP
jgi:hypothetical protein